MGGMGVRPVGPTAIGSAAPVEDCARCAEPLGVRCSRLLGPTFPGCFGRPALTRLDGPKP